MFLRIRRTPPGFIQPCLPYPAERPPEGPGWIHEIKHDGFRMMVRCLGGFGVRTEGGRDHPRQSRWRPRWRALRAWGRHLAALSPKPLSGLPLRYPHRYPCWR